MKAPRKLDKVIKEKTKSSYVVDSENYPVEEGEGEVPEEEDEDSFVYIADGDLDQIFTEG